MKENRSKVAILFLALAVLIFAGCSANNTSDMEWRCSAAECVEAVDMDLQEWANQNCAVTAENATVCQVPADNGQQVVVPIEQINFSAFKPQQCLQFACREEVPFKAANYSINLSDVQQ